MAFITNIFGTKPLYSNTDERRVNPLLSSIAKTVGGIAIAALSGAALFAQVGAASSAPSQNLIPSLTVPQNSIINIRSMPSFYPEIPSSNHPFFVKTDIPPSAAIAHAVVDYYEGAENCFEITPKNAESILNFLDDLKIARPDLNRKNEKRFIPIRSMKKLCQDVIDGIKGNLIIKPRKSLDDLEIEERGQIPFPKDLAERRTKILETTVESYKGRIPETPKNLKAYLPGATGQIEKAAKGKESKAFDYMHRQIADPKFFMKSEKQILEILKNGHRYFFEGTKDPAIAIGNFRKVNSIVHSETTATGNALKAHFEKDLINKGGTKAELLILKNSMKRLEQRLDRKFLDSLSEEEITVWNKIIYYPPDHRAVNELMKSFVRKLKRAYFNMQRSGEVDYVALAAWSHQELNRIHPFVDGNKRVARALSDSILTLGGYPPILMNDRFFNAYTNAMASDAKEPGNYAIFLSEAIDETAAELYQMQQALHN